VNSKTKSLVSATAGPILFYQQYAKITTMDIGKLLPGIKKNILLKNYTTFRIGGKAKYFFEVRTNEDLILAIKTAKKMKLPFFILGGGSNLLVSDKGFNGLIIKTENKKYIIKNNKIFFESGVLLNQLMKESINHNLAGLEWAAGIPGTVGGAIYGNAGWPSNKKNISSVVESVDVLKVVGCKLQVVSYKNKDCRFDYRNSIFKKNKNLIILGACLRLKKGIKEKIKKEIKNIIKKRNKKIPYGFSAGSVFKNPTPEQSSVRGKSAGALIEECDLKGKKIGNIKISEKHANFIINLGNGRSKDVKNLINLAKKSVKNKFGVILEEEIQYLPPKNLK
jgi:UDP-N-acetylmuramate dehydrogenase